MEIQFLGTSGHGIKKDRNLPAVLIDKKILLDCGEGTLKTLLGLDIDPKSIKTILFSHLHGDHFLGAISLLWELAFYSPSHPKCPQIYVPQDMSNNFINVVNSSFSPFSNVNFELDIIELKIHEDPSLNCLNLDLGKKKYSIRYSSTKHAPLCYAYRFNDFIVFSGDTGSPCENLKKLTRGCKILVHEATFPMEMMDIAIRSNHSTPIDAATLAQSSDVDRLFLYHVPPLENGKYGDFETDFLEHAKKEFKNIEIAKDLLRISDS